MATEKIVIHGAREHNLKNVHLELPRDKLIVFTGISGSGKSSLAFDTIYAEGQRRYVESLSSYARQFLGQMEKPDVDFVEGMSPAISIDQKTAGHNPRSTVGTITEIYDYLRLLYARVGKPHCPKCGRPIARQSPDQIVDQVRALPEGTKFQVLAPIVRSRKGEYEKLLEDLGKKGFARARVDGEVRELSEKIRLDRYYKHSIEVIVDRLVMKAGLERRLADSIETALNLAEGMVAIELVDAGEVQTYSQHLACHHCGLSFEELQPKNFSFNSPYGACPRCDGLGTHLEVDEELVVPDPDLPVTEGAIAPWTGRSDRVLRAHARVRRRARGRQAEDALAQAHEEAEGHLPVRHRRRPGPRAVSEPVRPDALLQHLLRRRRPLARAEARRGGQRLPAREDRGVHAGGAVPGVQGHAPEAGIARGHRRRECTSPSCVACRSPRPTSSSERSSGAIGST